MLERNRRRCLLLVSQAACVAVGLYMHRGQVDSSVCGLLEQQVWLRLERSAVELSAELGEPPSGEWSAARIRSDHSKAAWRHARPKPGGVALVDADWQVLSVECGEANRDEMAVGTKLAWYPFQSESEDGSGPRRGQLHLSDGKHLAVCQSLGEGAGHLLVHYPSTAIAAQGAHLTAPLWGISVVTLLWLAAVLAIVAWVILEWSSDNPESKQGSSLSATLSQARNLVRTRDAVIFGLAELADSRDSDTGAHLERMSAYSTVLASALRQSPKYASQITPAFVREIGISAALHDIGKVGIEDRILLKRGRFTAEERARMQKHAVIGGQCLQKIEQRLGTSNFLQMAREVALAHHERWDGRGYPYGLAGEAIPLSARIVAIADVYDALSSKRVYKPAYPHAQCVDIIDREAGGAFDPDIVAVWRTVQAKFRQIAERHASTVTHSGEEESERFDPGAPPEHDAHPLNMLAAPGEEVEAPSATTATI